MRHRLVSLLLAGLALVASAAPAAAQSLRVELITIGPGDQLWNAYGHTAIRVVDDRWGTDRVYNYGVASFDDPAFLWGFLRGRSLYRLEIFPWWESIVSSRAEDRTLSRQVLNLTQAQAQALQDFLEWNARPENREYFYNHQRDNCSTRVRDALDRVTGGALRRAVADWPLEWTYRDYTLAAAAGRYLFLLGLDLASGPNQSVLVDGWAAMYLPEYLRRGVSQAVADVGQGLPLAQPSVVVSERQAPPPAHGSRHAHRWLVLGLFAGLGVVFAAAGRRRERAAAWLGRPEVRGAGALLLLVALLLGLLGTVFLLFGLVSVLPDTHWNENAWVFWPLDAWLAGPAVRALRRGRWHLGLWLRRYLTLRVALLLVYAALKPTGLFPQDNWAFLFAIVLLFVGLRVGARETTARDFG